MEEDTWYEAEKIMNNLKLNALNLGGLSLAQQKSYTTLKILKNFLFSSINQLIPNIPD